jgi:hypothetical protein
MDDQIKPRRMLKFYPTIILMSLSLLIKAEVYQVGSSRSYISPNALYQANVIQIGDTIEIDAEDYMGTACLANWNKHNLLIRGVGGRPHLIADGEYIQGKGIWVLSGNDITVENIEFSGAIVPDNNGAGIRLDGTGLTVRYCYFHDNETGILTSNQGVGDVLVEHTEFDHNSYGDGFSHNIYVGHINSFTFRYNYSHHAVIGHNLKSRANENYIYYNRIMDEETGSSSRLIDLPNGGFCIVMGNLFMQGNNAPNSNMIGYGQEGLSNDPNELYFVNNTLVNKRQASCLFVDVAGQPDHVQIANNIFAGIGALTNGPITIFENNLNEVQISNLYFEDEANYNYSLTENSPAIDYGTPQDPVSGYSLTPENSYVHPTDFIARTMDAVIDAGAYEYPGTTTTHAVRFQTLRVWPNPTSGAVYLSPATIKRIDILDCLGRLISSVANHTSVDLTGLQPGVYILHVQDAGTQSRAIVIAKW